MKQKMKKKKNKGKSEPKGTSIDERLFKPTDRGEFGHWERDTIVDSKNIKNSGTVLTLVERKTIFQLTIKLKNRKSDTVFKAIKKLKINILN